MVAVAPWDEFIEGLASAPDASWHTLVGELAEMTKLTYTATQGSYFKPEDANATTAVGWQRDLRLTADPPAGMRALYFYQPATRRAVVAFRGTDLDRAGVSGQADGCADAMLWEDKPLSALPAYCKSFSADTLDYWSRAREYVLSVRKAHPTFQLLYTGHSLGAGLACLSAALDGQGLVANASVQTSLMSPAAAFSSPAWTGAFHRRTGVNASSLASHNRVYMLADEWDPVEGRAIQIAGSLVGQVCIYQTPPSPECTQCFRDHPLIMQRPSCGGCFVRRHIYRHYLHDLIGPTKARPICIDAADAKPPEDSARAWQSP